MSYYLDEGHAEAMPLPPSGLTFDFLFVTTVRTCSRNNPLHPITNTYTTEKREVKVTSKNGSITSP